ncbi:MAG: IS30 family transposase, partial [Sedimenticola sp.]|nr:IS30 family transposase [Sedimenticola sp.]
PRQAQRLADTRRNEADKARKVTAEIKTAIEVLIRQELSPQQVVDYLAMHKKLSLHHETVYQLIYADKAAGGDLYTHMRIASKPYRKRYGHYDRRGKIINRVGIDERPSIVDRRSRIGDWEGDTVIGKGRQSALLTMVERKTLYTVIIRLTGKRADLLAQAAIKGMKGLANRVKTITFDNGLEFAHHEVIAEGLGADIYFAHPYASWERGINENTNGLIRQYFPKGTDFSQVTDEQIRHVMDRLNNRPRKTRGGRSPNELFMGQRADLLAA